MAAKLKFSGNGALPFIWNVSTKVGPGSDSVNRPTDVELMNVLLVLALRNPKVIKFGINGNSIQPNRTSTFDPILGFWIFRFQQLGSHPTIDGIASPAHGQFYSPNTPWVIVTLNELAREADKGTWEILDQNSWISPGLRGELTAGG